ncbi:MAG: thioredoxin [Patescibacteria group bacterium]
MAELHLTNDNFDAEVLQSPVPVLVDFFAVWCGPCKVQGPIVAELAGELAGQPVKVAKLDVDEARDVAAKYTVMSIPTLIIFKDGQPVETMVGLRTKDDLKAKLQSLMV